jgi:hypothetical protein
MEPKVSLPYSQEPASGSYPAPDESSPYFLTLFPKDLTYSYVFRMDSSLYVYQMHFASVPCVLHASPISSSLLWSP